MHSPSLNGIRIGLLLVIFAAALPCRAVEEGLKRSADVIVYGATPGGFCAAIAAAREGASVILLEPTGHVGGVNTGGLCFSDSNQTMRATVMGLFDEWHRRIEADYQSRGVELPYRVHVKDQARWTYEPHVAARVTAQMLDEARVIVLTHRVLTAVVRRGNHIDELVTSDGRFGAKTFVDATYEGDLLAAAGVDWTLGREGRDEYGESLAGKRFPKPTMPVSGFDDRGRPLPLVTTVDAGPEDEGDGNVMTYSFRLCLTEDPENRVPFPAPASYDPERFEVVRRYARTDNPRIGFDLYELPGGKLDGNNSIGGQFSLGWVGAGNEWCDADANQRAEIFEAYKQYTLEFYHFLTTDPAVPEAIRQRFARLGLCKDEFAQHGHWSPQLYVREGRRMRGMYVLSQRDILDQPTKEDPIVVSSFPIDSHDCQRVALPGGGVVNEGTIFPVRIEGRGHGYPYQVPYRSILPKPAQCDNLLVPVALSSTHVAISSIRVEPTWMILGQSAGIAAALAASRGLPVQELPYPALRERLLAQGQVLDLPPIPEPLPRGIDPASLPGIVLDDVAAQRSGTWLHSTNFEPYIGAGYVHDDRRGDGESTASFRFTPQQSGRYQVLMAYSPHATRATNLRLMVRSAGREFVLDVDQTQAHPTGKAFRPIGIVELQGGHPAEIELSNAGTDGFVILDALQLLPLTD